MEPIRIRCAADLFQVLSFGAFEAKLAVLRDILIDLARREKVALSGDDMREVTESRLQIEGSGHE